MIATLLLLVELLLDAKPSTTLLLETFLVHDCKYTTKKCESNRIRCDQCEWYEIVRNSFNQQHTYTHKKPNHPGRVLSRERLARHEKRVQHYIVYIIALVRAAFEAQDAMAAQRTQTIPALAKRNHRMTVTIIIIIVFIALNVQ